jgi:hypothetical protein
MIARSVNAAADVIHRAQVNGTQTATGLAIALESAQLLVSPEMVHRMAALEQMETRLRALLPTEPLPVVMLAEGVALRAERTVWALVAEVLGVELPTRPRVDESVDKLTALLAPTQALREDDPNGLHHAYRLGRDLPETGGASC